MAQFSLDEVIDKAIQREEDAVAFYEALAARVDDAASQDALRFMAREERNHKTLLEKYKRGEMGTASLPPRTVVDARVVEALGAPDTTAPMHHKDVFLIAAQREKASHELYLRLAEMFPAGTVREMFLSFAGEELRHKEKAEYLYCNAAFPQTDGG